MFSKLIANVMRVCGLIINKLKFMDYIKLAQRTISMLSSMIESGECHTTRSREMKDNALNGLEQLRIHGVVSNPNSLN